MQSRCTAPKLSVRQAAEYEITVQGILTERYLARFDGFKLTVDTSLGRSTLSGRVLDQADLHGKLVQIRDLGLPLLSVTCRMR